MRIVLALVLVAALAGCTDDGSGVTQQRFAPEDVATIEESAPIDLVPVTDVDDSTMTPPPSSTPTSTAHPYTYSPDTYDAKLASCGSDPNGSTHQAANTTRRFVTLARAIYPDGHFVKISGTAFAGYISNGGPPGHAYKSTIDCWSTYFEFGGVGQVDFQAQSAIPGAPDYVTHFVVRDLP